MAAARETVVVLPLGAGNGQYRLVLKAAPGQFHFCQHFRPSGAPDRTRPLNRATGMPGLGTTKAACSNCSGLCSPNCTSTPSFCSAADCCAVSASLLRSNRRTRAPSLRNSRAAARPERPAPTTTANSPAAMRLPRIFSKAMRNLLSATSARIELSAPAKWK